MPLPVGARVCERVVGVEHEYVVRRGRAAVDFRRIVGRLDAGVPGLDPCDPLARRERWGGAITADGPEAEVVTPPIALRPGWSDEVARSAATGRARLAFGLAASVGADHRLVGFSTHLNVEVPAGSEVAVARRIARRAAPALMLALDRRDSPGLLVRPRPGRLEIGGEFADGASLRSALVLAAGVVDAAAHRSLPPVLRLDVAPAVERYGFYVDRRAFRTDLYATGRSTMLHRRGGRSVTAGEVLADVWEHARPFAEQWSSDAELERVDDVVRGRSPLPLERHGEAERCASPAGDSGGALAPSPFGDMLVGRARPGFSVAPLRSTWSLVVFEVAGDRRAVIAVARPYLASFLADLDAGALDGSIAAFLRSPATGRILASADQVDGPALFDGLSDEARLAPPERDPRTGRRLPSGGGGSGGDRPGKRRASQPTPPTGQVPASAGGGRRWLLVAGVVLALVLVGGALALAGGGGGGGDDRSASTGASEAVTTTDSGDPTGGAGGEPSGDPAAAGSLDLQGVDPCSVMDSATVAEITGAAVEFTNSGGGNSCFWGAVVPGEPAYVEVTLLEQDVLPTVVSCPLEPVAGIGEEAAGGTCTTSSQAKVALAVLDRGVVVSLLVNEPAAALAPEDLAPAIEAIFAQLS